MIEFQGKRITGWDTETDLIQPGVPAPPLVCFQWDNGRTSASLCLAEEAGKVFEREFEDCDLMVAHNKAFDTGVMAAWAVPLELIFDMYDSGKMVDTMLFERLGEIAGCTNRGPGGLDMVMVKHGFPQPPKEDRIRLTFNQFLFEPEKLVPGTEHYNYAVDDGTHVRHLLIRQIKRYGRSVEHATLTSLCRTHFWLTMMRNRGLKVDAKRLAKFQQNAEEHLALLRVVAWEAGFLKIRLSKETIANIRKELKRVNLWKPGIKAEVTKDQIDSWSGLISLPDEALRTVDDSLLTGGFEGKGCIANQGALRVAVSAAYEGVAPMTTPARNRKSKTKFVPQVSIGKVTLQDSGDPVLEEMAKMGEWRKAVTTDAKHLKRGIHFPVATRWGFADSGRTTSSGPNVQNPSRDSGARECYTPRDGYCFLDADYGALELATLAQFLWTNLGLTGMGERINRGIDPHSELAAKYLDITYEEAMVLKKSEDYDFKNVRNMCKPGSFGFPVGMSHETFVHFAKLSYKINLTEETALKIYVAWKKVNPDIIAFHKWVKQQKQGGLYSARVFGNNILRRNATFCSLANSQFQGPGAAVGEIAGWELAKACYLGKGPLSECWPVNFIHDQFIVECPIGKQHLAGLELKRIMETAPRKIMTDVRLIAEPCAAMLWSKEAKPVYDENGELGIWIPEAA